MLDPVSLRAVTRDGVFLGMRRYPRPGAPPVLLLHGFAQNLQAWDLPVEGHSFARHLAEAGFDVWLGNFRGHGRAPVRSGEGARHARIDDFGLYDVPAMVDRVRRTCGRAPLLVGHSMGGISALMYLQGATHDAAGRVRHDAGLAERRNAEHPGAILVAVPPVLSWRRRPGPLARLSGGYWEYNAFLQLLIGTRPLMALLDRLPVRQLRVGQAAATARRLSCLPGPLGVAGRGVVSLMGAATTRALAYTLWNPDNMDRRLIDAESRHTLEDVPVPVLRQFADWIHQGTMRSYVEKGAAPYVYSDHFASITLPVLFVAGDRDRVAPASTMRAHGLRSLGGRDRALLVLRGFGHNDLRMGLRAPSQAYPRLIRWLADRSLRATPTEGPVEVALPGG